MDGEGTDLVMAPRINPGMDPIQAKHRENMQAVMGALEEAFPGVGMCLFLFDEHASQPRANYISNTDRAQALKAVKQWVSRQESI